MHLSLVMETLFFFFSKKLKHKRKLKKLLTDLATTKQEAAITVLELNEKIKTLCEGKLAPRGQYYHVTATHRPWALGDAYSFTGNKAESKATVPGSVPGQRHAGRAWSPFCLIRDIHKLRAPGGVCFRREKSREWISSSFKEGLWGLKNRVKHLISVLLGGS